jgi:hypothetical protein
MTIHPTAIIDPKAEIDSEAEIGPYVVIEGAVKVMGGTRVMAHAYLTGWTEIGADNEIHPGLLRRRAAGQGLQRQQTFCASAIAIFSESMFKCIAAPPLDRRPRSATIIS